MVKKYPIEQSALYKCRSLRRLNALLFLDTDSKQIADIKKYYSFEINKKDGIAKRKITAPTKKLKTVQKRVLYLLQRIERPNWLISGEKGRSYIDNGKAHIYSNYFLAMDIKSFYDNCNREYVFRFFKDYLQVSGDIAGILTDIVTYDNGIPTGCPTSQLIAYYAYGKMFREISEIAQKYECIFTLYVDDMTFSSQEHFDVNSMKKEIDCTLRKYGHKPKYSKMKYYSHGKDVLITGTVVNRNHELKIPNKLQKKIYDGFQNVKDVDIKEMDCDKKKEIASLRGKLQAAKSIECNKFSDINKIVGNIEKQ